MKDQKTGTQITIDSSFFFLIAFWSAYFLFTTAFFNASIQVFGVIQLMRIANELCKANHTDEDCQDALKKMSQQNFNGSV